MKYAISGESSLFIPQIGIFTNAGCVIDIGGTFNTSNLFEPSNIIDNISLANDWNIVGDELKKAMCSYE